MLVLTRKAGERIRIDRTIEVVVLAVQKGKVRLGISAPSEVSIHREEVYQRIEEGDTDQHSGEPTGRLPYSHAAC